MNQASVHAWSRAADTDPMVSAPEDDFTNFLELGNFQLDFPAFDPAAHQAAALSHNGAADTNMDDGPESNARKEPHTAQRPGSSVQMMAQHSQASAEALMEMNMQAQLFQRQQQQQQQQQQQRHRQQQQQQQQQQQHHQKQQQQRYQARAVIPPTPSSIEMHGGTAAYYQHLDAQSQALVERYQRMKDEQMVFTPLVSPAVTPLETQFTVPEYAVPAAYFSPLTSPALEAQQSASQRPAFPQASRAETSVTTSPVDLNFDLGPPGLAQATSQPRPAKVRRRMSTPRTPARVVRQSPSMKPQRRKTPASTIIPAKELSQAAESGLDPASTTPQGPGRGLNVPYSRDSSGTESISPEPLSEMLMGPPPAPKPDSAHNSPFLAPTRNGEAARKAGSTGLHPATPASLMRLPNQAGQPLRQSPSLAPGRAVRNGADEMPMEDLALPEAIDTSQPALPPGTTASVEGQATPTTAGTRTPKVRPINTSAGRATVSASQSPALQGMSSPQSASAGKKNDGKAGGRVGKKRNSNNSVQVSPALRPKISPSIKPLLPEGAIVSAETSALLLASKSNYQNILEGNHLPGVSYPEALSTNLTSKRTSHKIAEQGRRNRINNALQEIASLLPSSNGRDSSSSGTEAGNTAAPTTQQSNSKASTVEMAIDYIKSLQAELAETKGKLELAQKQLVDQS